jgi:hypothetical protein
VVYGVYGSRPSNGFQVASPSGHRLVTFAPIRSCAPSVHDGQRGSGWQVPTRPTQRFARPICADLGGSQGEDARSVRPMHQVNGASNSLTEAVRPCTPPGVRVWCQENERLGRG